MLDNIREELYDILTKRDESGLYLTHEQQVFLDSYSEIYEKKQKEKKDKADKKAKRPVDKNVSG